MGNNVHGENIDMLQFSGGAAVVAKNNLSSQHPKRNDFRMNEFNTKMSIGRDS